nr:hypothetical protein [Candidatus Paceibacterota bacterium]
RTYQQALDAIVAHIPEEQHAMQKSGAYNLDTNEHGIAPAEATIIRMYRPTVPSPEVSVWDVVRTDLLAARNACIAWASLHLRRFVHHVQSHSLQHAGDLVYDSSQTRLSSVSGPSHLSIVPEHQITTRYLKRRITPSDHGCGTQSIPVTYTKVSIFETTPEECDSAVYPKTADSKMMTLLAAFHIVLMQLTGEEQSQAVSKKYTNTHRALVRPYTHVSASPQALRWF